MSTKHASPAVEMNGFRGIDHAIRHDTAHRARDVVNLRIRADGGLEKRRGFRFLADLGDKPRAFCRGLEQGRAVGYAIVTDQAYRIDLSTGEYTSMGTLATASGNACLFFFGGKLYLMDESGFYVYDSDSFLPVYGYVPLIGKDWINNIGGEHYEPRNLLNRHGRITYRIEEPVSVFLPVEEDVEQILAVYRNGVALPPEQFTYHESYHTVNVRESALGDRFEVLLTFSDKEKERYADLRSCSSSTLLGTVDNTRLFFFGGRKKATVFCTAHVNAASLAESLRRFEGSSDLYFPVGYEFSVGEGRYPVQSIAPHYDRLLIFTEGDTWMAAPDSAGTAEFPSFMINSDLGCASFGACTLMGNSPVTVERGSIRLWEQTSDLPDQCNATSLSDPIAPLLSAEEYRELGVWFDRLENELWLYNRRTGTVWVRRADRGDWYRFTGIRADRFFEADGTSGFLCDGRLYVFDRALSVDRESDGSEIEIFGEYVSHPLDFDTPNKKNLASLTLYWDPNGSHTSLTFTGDSTAPVSTVLRDPSTNDHSILHTRLTSGRFRHATLRVSLTGSSVIHGLTLRARPN